MAQEWIIPSYSYDGQATLELLLKAFMEANDNPELSDMARDMSLQNLTVKVDTLRKWLQGKWTPGLTSTRMAGFMSVTGIDLDRLMVIGIKREILEDLDRIDVIRKDDPSLAWMLTRDPDLHAKIDFGMFPTRGEILIELKDLCAQIEGGLVGLQIGEDPSTINSWGRKPTANRKRGSILPTGKALKRIIIMLTIGFIRPERSNKLCRDTIRFKVLSERLLGVDVQEVLGVSTFEEALVELFRGCETRTANIKANRTGLGITAVKRLAKWTFPSNGRTSSGVIIQILRHLMETRQPDKLDAFERAVASLEACGRKQRVTEPVFWHSVDVENEAPELTQREPKTTEPDPIPTPAPPRARRPRPRIHMLEPVDDLEEAHLEEMGASEYLQVSLMGAIGQITEILRLHPALIERLPDEWKGAGEQQNEGNCQRCPLEDALTGSDCSHSKERERAVIQRVRELEVILGVVCEWPPSARDRTLREMDDPIIRITDLLEAMGLKEPARFLADIALQREAEGLVGKSS